ncbi:MAG: SurA N-terminal domain-containing protein [Tissierellia bacterium]|nr:SurA N-terminal domain-containing protein [Tissierellia bacterium]
MKKIREKYNKISIAKISLILFLLVGLSSCSNDNKDVVAIVNDREITKVEFQNELNFYTKYYANKYGSDYLAMKNEDGKRNLDILKENLLDSMIQDEVMLKDLEDNDISIDKDDVNSLEKEGIDNLNGKDSLKANLSAFDIDLKVYEDVLLNDVIRKKHKESFLDNIDISENKILRFYDKNEDLHQKYKYIALEFKDENYANTLRDSIKNKSLKDLVDKDVQNFNVINSDFVYFDDPLLKKSKMSKKGEISNVFSYENSYYILQITSLNTNEKELILSARDLLYEKEYDHYYKDLMKKARIKIFN